MRFSTVVNFVLLGVATTVSALPIAQFTGSLELENRDDFKFDVPDMLERDFDELALYGRADPIPHSVALHKSKVGTPDEHWALHFHPQTSQPKAEWHTVDAASEKGKKGVLQTEMRTKGGNKASTPEKDRGYDASRQGDHHMILGHFTSGAKAKEAAKSLKDIHCTEKFPGENCVDWTKQAVVKLHADGHISDEHKAAFLKHYEDHAGNVRTTTGTPANIAKTL